MNPLLSKFETPFETVPFDLIKPEHFLPALIEGIKIAKEEIKSLKENTEKATFANVCESLEKSGSIVNTCATVFFNLHSAESNEEIQNIAKEFSPLLSAFGNDIALDLDLFEKIKEVYSQRESLGLNKEQMTLLEQQYKGFTRNGALLNDAEKNTLRDIDQELSNFSLVFSDNILDETNTYIKVIDTVEELDGLPDSALEAARMLATEKDHDGKYVVTLEYPSYKPLITYANNRELRQELYLAFGSRGFRENDKNNSEIVKKITDLKHQRANLLGHKTHANFVLEERMAESPVKVIAFLDNLLEKAKPTAIKEIEEVKAFAQENGGPTGDAFRSWDMAFWSEKLKQEKYSFDSEQLKPFFKLEHVVDGVFEVATKLFGITFNEQTDIPTYHKDVRTYEVVDDKGAHLGVFYTDFFPRSGKRAGAWMTSYRGQKVVDGVDERPHVSIVCNFTKPTKTKPSLLTFNEVTTLFHEFGHALHGLLTKCTYEELSGTSVYWDFVELPSQILENWAYEKECLDLFAKHFETDALLPAEMITKIKESSSFQEGIATLRQISFGRLDMAWHSTDPSTVSDVATFEDEAMKECQLLPRVEGICMSTAFSHIFAGGYSAGYYSYKWAEVLDADAFEAFKEKGIFNKEVATKFKENILEKGGTTHPMDLYLAFRGKEPTPDALLKRAGLSA